jgi:hypothetical protein
VDRAPAARQGHAPHHQRPAQRLRCRSAARANARPRCGARRHCLAPGLDPERACNESIGASFSFGGGRSTTERASPGKAHPLPSPTSGSCSPSSRRLHPRRSAEHPPPDRSQRRGPMALGPHSRFGDQLRGAVTDVVAVPLWALYAESSSPLIWGRARRAAEKRTSGSLAGGRRATSAAPSRPLYSAHGVSLGRATPDRLIA